MKSLRRFVLRLAVTAFIVVALAFAVSPWYWFPALLTHFVPLYAAGAWLCVGLAFVAWQRVLWALLASALTVWCVLPLVDKPAHPEHSLLFYNALIDNPDPGTDAQRIVQQHPDMVALVEQGGDAPHWQALREAYPYQCARADLGVFSLWLGSKQPLASCQAAAFGDVGWLRVTAQGCVVYVLHPPPPISPLLADIQQDYLRHLAQQIAAEQQPVLVVGDLNLTPFAPLYWRFVSKARLRSWMGNATPTWRPAGLHLDHVLGRALRAGVRVLPAWHSDHRALLVQWTADAS